jgi:hypothetical protein
MPLTPQERAAIVLTLPVLDSVWGPTWLAPDGTTLAEEFPEQKTPECVVTNGTLTAAVEVKRLMGDAGWLGYHEAWQSLRRRLIPGCGGRYMLVPFHGTVLPLNKKLVERVAKQMEELAPSMQVGDVKPVRVPRPLAELRLIRTDRPDGSIYCSHSEPVIEQFSERLAGWFWLADDDALPHSFVTEECRSGLYAKIEAASMSVLAGGDGHLEWEEEWALHRLEDAEDGHDNVEIVAAVTSDVFAGIDYTVTGMLLQGLRKFGQRWGDKHVIVLEDAYFDMCEPQHVARVIASHDGVCRQRISLVALIHKGEASIVWQPS